MVRPRGQRAPPVDEHEVPRQAEDPAVPPVVHPDDVGLHQYLQFTSDLDRRDREIILARVRTRGYAGLRYLSWDILRELDFAERAEELCSSPWRALLTFQESVSDTLAVEFFSTFHMLTPLPDYHHEAGLTFRLGGVERRMSLRQFAVHMGLYTEEELDTPAFTEGISDWPQGVTAAHVWARLGNGELGKKAPKSTALRDPLIRILHRAISHGITARGDSSVGNVMHSDLFYLYCLTEPRHCQLAERLARYLFHVRQQKYTQAIFGGGYVLRLAKSLGVAIPHLPGVPRLVAVPRPIDMEVLFNMRNLVMKEGSGYVLIPQPVVAPTAVTGAHDHEAGGSGAGGDDQVHASTDIPDVEMTDTPTDSVPPPVSPVQPAPQPQPQPRIIYERSYGRRIQVIERMIALEFARAEEDRSVTRRTLQALAAASIPGYVVPDLPAPPQDFTDFIRLHTPQPDQQPPAP